MRNIHDWLVPANKDTERNTHRRTPPVVFSKALCSRNIKPILMRFQHEYPNLWLLTSSVQIKGSQVEKEVHLEREISGSFDTSFVYRGCPYCKSKGYVLCFCGNLCCWNMKDGVPTPKRFKCPWCGKKGTLNERIKRMRVNRGC